MKTRVLVAGTVCALSAAAACAQSPELPHRKAGQWEISVDTSVRPGHPTVMEQCIDEKTDADLQKAAIGMSSKMNCTSSFRKTANGYETDATCKTQASTVKSHAVTSGDFSSAYQVEVNATYDPPLMGMSQAKTITKVRYLGPCKAGMQPGDVSINGTKIANVGGAGAATK